MRIEWSLVFFSLFAGLAAGVFTGIAVSEWSDRAERIRFKGALLTLAALIISGCSSVLHLGHPERIFGALKHPESGIFLEALFMGLFGLMVVLYLLALRRETPGLLSKLIATLGTIPAVLLAFAVGYTYMMPSRPAWDSWILPLLYLASAAVMGCFCIAALLADDEHEEYPDSAALTKTSLMFLGIQAILIMAYIGYLGNAPYPAASRSLTRLLMGDLGPLFWIGLVLLGFLVPFIIMLRAKKSESLSEIRYGLMCVLMAGIAFRALMFSLGSAVRNFF